MPNHNYNKQLKHLARANRNDMTPAEKELWYNVLRLKKINGHKFLRQRPIDKYIADFVCLELKLIIELDGSSHNLKSEDDLTRDNVLIKLGYTVIRLKNEEVMNNLSGVRLQIESVCVSLSSPL